MFDYNEYEKRASNLFARWCDAQRMEENWCETTLQDIEQDSFIRDGIVSENYDGVLFILKEANILNHKGLEEPSERTQLIWYQDYYSKGIRDNRPQQLEKIARMYLAVRCIRDLTQVHHALGRVAIINLNKRGGGNREKIVLAYSKKYKEFIIEQIGILEPKIIVCLGTHKLLRKVIPELYDRYPIIPMWHPAYFYHPQQRHITMEKYINEFKERLSKVKIKGVD